jgi:hypothetical protein
MQTSNAHYRIPSYWPNESQLTDLRYLDGLERLVAMIYSLLTWPTRSFSVLAYVV